MRKILFGIVILAPILFIVSCGPSEEERRQIEFAKQQTLEAEKAADEERRQAEAVAAEERKKAEEERRRAEIERDQTRSAEVSVAYREWLKKMMSDPSIKPRRYVSALEDVSVRGNTLILGISISDKDEAIMLCNFTVAGWWDRDKYGVPEAEVVFTGNGSTLAKSVHLNTGGHVCR
jgi:DNA polymerase III alpha subunit (gram-positive type)